MAVITSLKRAILHHKTAVAAGVMVVICATVGVVLLLKAGASASANAPQGIPTTMAQIRAMERKDPRLAELGLIQLRQNERLSDLEHLRSLTPAERAAVANWIRQQQAQHSSSNAQRVPADASGFFPVLKSGAGPWPSCQFFGHNLYVSPPSGSSGIQYMIYAGNVLPTKACIDNPRSINPSTAGYGGVFEATWNDPNSATKSPTLVESSIKSPLTAISVSGNIVLLRSLSGQEIRFNVVTRKFEA